MKKAIIQGRFLHKLRSMAISGWIAVGVLTRRVLGKPLVAEWPFLVEPYPSCSGSGASA